MIAELFYPKELKQLIADLRAKDDLNEDNLANVNGRLTSLFFLIIFAMIIICIAYADRIFGSLANSVSFLLWIFFMVYLQYNRIHKTSRIVTLITVGARARGTVIHFNSGIGAVSAHWICKYEFLDGSNKKQVRKCVYPLKLGGCKLSEGSNVIVAYDPQNPELNTAVTPILDAKFNLSKIAKAGERA